MRVEEIRLEQYRNISQLQLSFHPDTNLIFGENAQGKTNLLESLMVLSTGSSHRTNTDREVVALGQRETRIQGRIHSFQRDYLLEYAIGHGTRRKLQKNKVSVTKMQELTDVFQTVLFCPEDLSLVKAAPLLRRRFLDVAISQLRPQYAVLLSEYKRLYLHKSKILKEQSKNLLDTLPEFNYRMAQVGSQIIHYRAHFIKRLQEVVPAIHQEFSGGRETCSLAYRTVSTIRDPQGGGQILFSQVLEHQESHYHAELASGRCLTGPHKDDLVLFVGEVQARQFASQGQTRTLALSLKLGEREIFYQETGEYPVLLLDDVLSELDVTRQEFVLHRLKTGQSFITSCDPHSFGCLLQGGKFHMVQGVATAVD